MASCVMNLSYLLWSQRKQTHHIKVPLQKPAFFQPRQNSHLFYHSNINNHDMIEWNSEIIAVIKDTDIRDDEFHSIFLYRDIWNLPVLI